MRTYIYNKLNKLITVRNDYGFEQLFARQVHLLTTPSTETQKIQECHITVGHIICGLIEESLFGAQYNPHRQHAAV